MYYPTPAEICTTSTAFLYLYFQLDFSSRLLTTSDPPEFSFPDKTDASPDREYCSVLSNVGLAGDKVEGP